MRRDITKKTEDCSSVFGAQDKTRTCTSLRSLPPQSSVSTNFTTWALRFADAKVVTIFDSANFFATFFNKNNGPITKSLLSSHLYAGDFFLLETKSLLDVVHLVEFLP